MRQEQFDFPRGSENCLERMVDLLFVVGDFTLYGDHKLVELDATSEFL